MNLPFNVNAIVGYTYFICTDFVFSLQFTRMRDLRMNTYGDVVTSCDHTDNMHIDIASVDYLVSRVHFYSELDCDM